MDPHDESCTGRDPLIDRMPRVDDDFACSRRDDEERPHAAFLETEVSP